MSEADVSMRIGVNAYTCWQPIGPVEWEDYFRSQCPEDLRDEIDQHIPRRIAVRWSLLGVHAVRCSGCDRMLWQEPAREGVNLVKRRGEMDSNGMINALTEPGKLLTAFRHGVEYAALTILTNPEPQTLFGKRMKITVEWPDGEPDGDLIADTHEQAQRNAIGYGYARNCQSEGRIP